MNNMQEDFVEVSDLDQDIKKRKELIEQAKAIDFEGDEREVIRQISDLRRQWKRISYWESAYEESLEAEFEGYLDVFFARRREDYKKNKEAKDELIQEAKQLSKSSDWNETTKKMNSLMDQWKLIKTAGRDEDESLWEEFNGARQAFYQRKEKHWEDTKKRFENAKKVKEELIEQAKGLTDSEEWKETSAQFQEMMDQWKQVGSAGREYEEDLWKEFNDLRQQFYSRREEYHHHLSEIADNNYSKKKGFIQQAQEILDSKRYNREDTQAMKQLGIEWKAVGFSGRNNEDKVWKTFRGIMDQYFAELKENNERRHMDWRQRMLDTRARKQELIISQRNQLKRMQEDMIGMISERAVNELKEDMEYKKEFIAQLESELEELDKKIAE